MSTRFMHWNVFEDGLADTPACVGFSEAFSQRFSALLSVLNDSGEGASFYGFKRERDFSELPDVVPINNTAAFLGYIDLVYTLVYHCLGGEARLTEDELPLEYEARKAVWTRSGGGVEGSTAGVPIGGTLRSLFLQSSLAHPAAPPSPSNPWKVDDFDEQLERLERLAAHPSAEKRAADLRAIRDSTFDPLSGTLSWTARVARRVWKRETLTYQKWMGITGAGEPSTRGLRIFIAPPSGISAAAAAALSRLCWVGPGGQAIRALVEVELSSVDGSLTRLRTPTFQSAVRWLLAELVAHARGNRTLRSAVSAFVGRPTGEEAAAHSHRPAADDEACTADEAGDEAGVGTAWAGGGAAACGSREDVMVGSMVEDIFSALMDEMRAWSEVAALKHRHATVCRHIAAVAPEVVTLVEFDDVWRAMPWQRIAGRSYALVHGRGTASVLYDAEAFERAQLATVDVPSMIRLATERGEQPAAGGADVPPKNSCVALLRRLADGLLVLVISVHLESGPPSDSRKVELRAAQVHSLLAECTHLAGALAAAGYRAALVVGGDFNALREEFVHGNTAAFFDAPAVGAVRPPLKRAPRDARLALAPEPPIASLGPSGELRLHCAACDGGYLVEASGKPPRPNSAPGGPSKGVEAPGRSSVGSSEGGHGAEAMGDVAGEVMADVAGEVTSDVAGEVMGDVAGGPCTRAGSSMTIDFVLLGSVGGALSSARLYHAVPEAEAAASAHPADGIRHAVTHWGSDHLPVAADAELVSQPPSVELISPLVQLTAAG